VSRGAGRVQRQVIARLLATPQRRLSRAELEDDLHKRGVRPANTLRAVKSLERSRVLVFKDVADRKQATVVLLAPGHCFTDDQVFELLRSANPS
jgi:hypothetical protein